MFLCESKKMCFENNLSSASVKTVESYVSRCFVFADLPWYQQKAASVIFATPPTSTYQEVTSFFIQSLVN